MVFCLATFQEESLVARYCVYAVVYSKCYCVHSLNKGARVALKADREIANLKAEDGQRQVVAVASGAGGGLCIEVRSGGRSKTWLYRYRINNKARKFTLGSYPARSLATARVEHGKAVALVKEGEDPAAVQSIQSEAVCYADI
ncbi:Arm DNA-binding domain-containing protein [Aeromonas hydrophila]|uniref:Arm DNA-binding domain-containing protein n=1 Tax=Aeromonas hydrophila TaxID=644 RepID=UPI0035578F58|nr:DUF4102 domain-containing protein [Aeromonas hydrophila]